MADWLLCTAGASVRFKVGRFEILFSPLRDGWTHRFAKSSAETPLGTMGTHPRQHPHASTSAKVAHVLRHATSDVSSTDAQETMCDTADAHDGHVRINEGTASAVSYCRMDSMQMAVPMTTRDMPIHVTAVAQKEIGRVCVCACVWDT
eukprot:Opistho-2@35682